MRDYTILYKDVLPPDADWPGDYAWDVFVSAFNSSERVQWVYDNVKAGRKHLLILPDYQYRDGEYPSKGAFTTDKRREDDLIIEFLNGMSALGGKSLCVDITGFVKPYMMFLMMALVERGIKMFDVLYSEPLYYIRKEETLFSDADVVEVRQIAGFEGAHEANTGNDIIIIGAGYDDELIKHAAEHKDNARKIQIFGLPSLLADMYQENVLRASRAEEAIGGKLEDHIKYYAPAYDPFVTASVLAEIVASEEARAPLTNLYLCPLATKPQALGFAVYYVTERIGTSTSMVYPICRSHKRKTSEGRSRTWRYRLEFP